MDIAVGCYAYGNMFSCMAFKLYLGSSDDIPTEQREELALFSQFRDAPIPKPRDGHVISGHWRRTRSRASTPVARDHVTIPGLRDGRISKLRKQDHFFYLFGRDIF